jgi:hypothetical protein
VQAWCRRRLTSVDDDTFTTTGSARIELPATPVRAVSSVLVDSVETLLSWNVSAAGVLDWVGTAVAPAGDSAVVVTYDSGFAEVDYRLVTARAVAVRLASRLYQNPLDRGSFSGPDGLSFSPAAGVTSRLLTGDEQMMLSPCRDMAGFA